MSRRRRPSLVPPTAVTAESKDCIVDCGLYVDGERTAFTGDYADAARRAREEGGFVWLGLHEPSASQVEGIAAEFDLHPLAVEDAVKAHQRPKLERYDNMLFVVLKTVRYVEHEEVTSTSQIVGTGEIMIFIGPHFAITVRHGQHGELRSVRRRLESEPDLLVRGPSAVLYAVADTVVDAYMSVAAETQTDVEELEASVFAPGRSRDVERIYQLKREVLELRRAVMPLSAALHTLAERALPQVPEDVREYFRDVADHHNRVADQISGFDELLSSILQANVARINLSENEDMRRISAWAAIFVVPTAICSVYGMNFTHMPETHWRFGYPAVMAVIFIICFLLYRGFKRNGWL
jgi:magnesium transporter